MAGFSCTLVNISTSDSIAVRAKEFPVCNVALAVDWPAARAAANGEVYGVDRGGQSDVYTADLVIFGTVDEMADVAAWLQANGRNKFRLTAISGYIFPPHIDQSGTIKVSPVARDLEGRVFFAPTEYGANELAIKLRLVDLGEDTYVGTPSIAGLTLGENFTQGASNTVAHTFSDSGAEVDIDLDADAGLFSSPFVQDTVATRNSMLLLTGDTIRQSAFDFPTLPGVEYPFGEQRGPLPKRCKQRVIACVRKSLDMWEVKPEWRESFE